MNRGAKQEYDVVNKNLLIMESIELRWSIDLDMRNILCWHGHVEPFRLGMAERHVVYVLRRDHTD